MLRYFTTILLILLSFTSNSFSQFNVGISGEISSSKFGGVAPDNANYTSIAGFGGSLIGEIRLVKDVYLSLQPGFQTQGSNIKFGNENSIINDTTVTFKISQSYFNIPLNLKIIAGTHFYAGAGFAIGFLSSAEISNEYVDSTIDIKNKFKSTDVTANFNVGYQMSIGKPNLFLS
ncbi:MAG: outer membrane beta-barrel protein [Ignavibacteria bacterium]|nr:outer membrane beta-barrel protein [Ignavibacteria bacterium]